MITSYCTIDYSCPQKKQNKMHGEVLPHLPYVSDLSKCNFHLFKPLKEALSGLDDDDDIAQFVYE